MNNCKFCGKKIEDSETFQDVLENGNTVNSCKDCKEKCKAETVKTSEVEEPKAPFVTKIKIGLVYLGFFLIYGFVTTLLKLNGIPLGAVETCIFVGFVFLGANFFSKQIKEKDLKK